MGKRLTAFRRPTKNLLTTSKISNATLLLFDRIVKCQLERYSNLSGTLFHLSWNNIPSNMEQPSSLVITRHYFVKLSLGANLKHGNGYSNPLSSFIYDVARGMQMYCEGITMLPCKSRYTLINSKLPNVNKIKRRCARYLSAFGRLGFCVHRCCAPGCIGRLFAVQKHSKGCTILSKPDNLTHLFKRLASTFARHFGPFLCDSI